MSGWLCDATDLVADSGGFFEGRKARCSAGTGAFGRPGERPQGLARLPACRVLPGAVEMPDEHGPRSAHGDQGVGAAPMAGARPRWSDAPGGAGCRPVPREVGGWRGVIAGPFPSAPSRTVRAPFSAHRSPVSEPA